MCDDNAGLVLVVLVFSSDIGTELVTIETTRIGGSTRRCVPCTIVSTLYISLANINKKIYSNRIIRKLTIACFVRRKAVEGNKHDVLLIR